MKLIVGGSKRDSVIATGLRHASELDFIKVFGGHHWREILVVCVDVEVDLSGVIQSMQWGIPFRHRSSSWSIID